MQRSKVLHINEPEKKGSIKKIFIYMLISNYIKD